MYKMILIIYVIASGTPLKTVVMPGTFASKEECLQKGGSGAITYSAISSNAGSTRGNSPVADVRYGYMCAPVGN
jgi:hypothetical protein